MSFSVNIRFTMSLLTLALIALSIAFINFPSSMPMYFPRRRLSMVRSCSMRTMESMCSPQDVSTATWVGSVGLSILLVIDAMMTVGLWALPMTEEQWDNAERLRLEIDRALAEAMDAGDPAGEQARRLCDLHRQWLLLYWGESRYSKGAHLAMGQMYVADERFQAYYDRVRDGGAAFLLRALESYCKA